MTTYIIWAHEDDDALRIIYEGIVGETLQPEPKDNGTHYMVGSRRITEAHQAELLFALPDLEFASEMPEGFGNE